MKAIFRVRITAVLILLTSLIFTACDDDSVAEKTSSPNSKTLISFSFSNPQSAATINEFTKKVSITVPFGTDLTNLVADFSIIGKSITVNGAAQTSGKSSNNFTNPVVYTIYAENGSSVSYTVTVYDAGDTKKITEYSILENTGIINESAKTISVTVPYRTNPTSLIADFSITGTSLSVGSTSPVNQISGTTPNDFTNPVIYTVHAQNGSTASYTVTVIKAPPTSLKAITSYSILGTYGTIDESAKTIKVTVQKGTALTGLVSSFSTSGVTVKLNNASGAEQTSGTTPNDFTNPVIYHVTAEDTSSVTYTVTVTESEFATGDPHTFTLPGSVNFNMKYVFGGTFPTGRGIQTLPTETGANPATISTPYWIAETENNI